MADIDVWRHPNERAELVERCINAERQVAQLRHALREATGTPNYVQALIAQIGGLERNLAAVMRQAS